MSTPDGLEDLRAAIMADAAIQETLGSVEDTDRFIALALEVAGARGIALDAAALRAALPPDPLGLSRWNASAVTGARWPPPGWLPIQIVRLGDQLVVDWAYFGAAPLRAPFFEGDIRQALARPFGRLFRYRMTLADFVAHADGTQSLTPSGLIFHMSRCGSTLVSQMLAASAAQHRGLGGGANRRGGAAQPRAADAAGRPAGQAAARHGRRLRPPPRRRRAPLCAQAGCLAHAGAAAVPPRLSRRAVAFPVPRTRRTSWCRRCASAARN